MEISRLLNKLNVYTDRGTYVGRVADAQIDTKERRITGLSLVDINRQLLNVETTGAIIPYRWVLAVGDIVIIKELPDMYSHEAGPNPDQPTPI